MEPLISKLITWSRLAWGSVHTTDKRTLRRSLGRWQWWCRIWSKACVTDVMFVRARVRVFLQSWIVHDEGTQPREQGQRQCPAGVPDFQICLAWGVVGGWPLAELLLRQGQAGRQAGGQVNSVNLMKLNGSQPDNQLPHASYPAYLMETSQTSAPSRWDGGQSSGQIGHTRRGQLYLGELKRLSQAKHWLGGRTRPKHYWGRRTWRRPSAVKTSRTVGIFSWV